MTPSSGTSAVWEPRMTFWPFTSLGTHSSMERGTRTPWPFSPCRGSPWLSQWIMLVRLGYLEGILCSAWSAAALQTTTLPGLLSLIPGGLSFQYYSWFLLGELITQMGPVLYVHFIYPSLGWMRSKDNNNKRIRHHFQKKVWAFSHSTFLLPNAFFSFLRQPSHTRVSNNPIWYLRGGLHDSCHGLWSSSDPGSKPALPFDICLTLDKLLHLTEPQFINLKNRIITLYRVALTFIVICTKRLGLSRQSTCYIYGRFARKSHTISKRFSIVLDPLELFIP